MAAQECSITAFYKFFPVADPSALHAELSALGAALGIRGLVLLAKEGINGTVAGEAHAIAQWKERIESLAPGISFKESASPFQPFRRFHVKVREEIVHLGDPDVVPGEETGYVSPEEWHALLEREDIVVLDTRNIYETAIGMFEGAVDPQLDQFSEFPEYAARCGIPKHATVLLYCTGGIRCEKAAVAMRREGYQHVRQLRGGILAYLKEFPEGHFRGECFVFDHRAAVDSRLRPSARYRLCPHCGDPGDQRISCAHCSQPAVICETCGKESARRTCSKDCAHRQNLLTAVTQP